MRLHRIIFALFMTLLLLNCTLLLAQRVTVYTYADPETIGRDEETTYTVEIKGEGSFKAPTPTLPELADFNMKGMMSGSSSSYSIVNGTVSESVTKTYTFRLMPRRTGNLSIPSFNVIVNGKSFTTQKVNVRVLEVPRAGTRQPNQVSPQSQSGSMPMYMMDPFGLGQDIQPVGDMEIRAIPEKTSVYVGEPLLVTYRLYTNQPISALELRDEKDFGGYGKEVYTETNRLNFENVKYRDQRYKSAVLKVVSISPNRSGEIELPRLTADAQIGSIGLYSKTLESNPVKIMVKPLPDAGKPLDYSGAVGSFKVSDKLAKNLLRLGESLEYKLIINGRGNFNQFSNPAYPAQQTFRIASPITDNRIQAGISGMRTISYLLIPRSEGKYLLPGVRFNWFDPASGSYKSFSGSPQSVEVKPGNVLTYISNVFQRENIRTLTPFNPLAKYHSTPLLARSFLYWFMVILIILSLLPSWVLANRKKLQNTNPELAAMQGSGKVLKKYLRQADASALSGSKDFYPQAEKGLMSYLSDKYRVPHRHSTSEKIYQLRLKGLDEELVTSLEAFLKRCQEARFMPGGFDLEIMMKDLEMLKQVIASFIKLPDRTKFRFR
jgi:hypothetical protein